MIERRKPTWEYELSQYIQRSKNNPFKWGTQDCALWACGAIDAQCGTQLVLNLGARYESALGAQRFIREHGWRNLEDAARALVAPEPLSNATEGSRGDLVYVPPGSLAGGTMGCLMILTGTQAIGTGEERLQRVGFLFLLSKGAKIFRV